jgi:hypothetical protein
VAGFVRLRAGPAGFGVFRGLALGFGLVGKSAGLDPGGELGQAVGKCLEQLQQQQDQRRRYPPRRPARQRRLPQRLLHGGDVVGRTVGRGGLHRWNIDGTRPPRKGGWRNFFLG